MLILLLLLLLLLLYLSFLSSMTSLFLMIQGLWDILCLWVSSCDVSKDRNALMFIINSSALHSYLHGLIHPDIAGEARVRNDCKYLTTHCNILEDLNFLYYSCDYPNLMSLLLLFFWLTFELTVRWAFPIGHKKGSWRTSTLILLLRCICEENK